MRIGIILFIGNPRGYITTFICPTAMVGGLFVYTGLEQEYDFRKWKL